MIPNIFLMTDHFYIPPLPSAAFSQECWLWWRIKIKSTLLIFESPWQGIGGTSKEKGLEEQNSTAGSQMSMYGLSFGII